MNVLLVGASRGIGVAVAQHLVGDGFNVLSVCRTAAVAGEWMKADVSTDKGIQKVLQRYSGMSLDALRYMGGVWESAAFTSAYQFSESSTKGVRNVIDVNLLAPILLSQGLVKSLERSDNPRIVSMGPTSGLYGHCRHEVAYSASKFGLRGAARAIRLALPRIGITTINTANVAT